MRRALLTEVGWSANLRLEDAEVPRPARDEVLIEVEACGVCHRDCIDRAGGFAFMRTPIAPGHEAVGRVIEVGPDVTMWRVGDRVATMHRDACGTCGACRDGETSLCTSAAAVLGLLIDGGYASHLVAPERAFYRVPREMPAAHAAILHCTFGTAYRGLTRFGRGDRVVVTGANGGVGSAAIQVARRLGAEVIAVARDASARGYLNELGAADVVSELSELGAREADVVLDCVGAPTFEASLRCLRVGGRLVAIGNVVRERVALSLGYAITYGLSIVGSSGATPADMAALLALHDEQPLDFCVRELALDRADAAQRAVRAGGLRGRIVLVP